MLRHNRNLRSCTQQFDTTLRSDSPISQLEDTAEAFETPQTSVRADPVHKGSKHATTRIPSGIPQQQAAPKPASKDKSKKPPQPATKDVTRPAPTGPYSLRTSMKGNSNYKGFVKSVQPKGHDMPVGTKLLRSTLFMTILCCLLPSGSANVLDADDVLTFPEFGAVAEKCGKIAVEKEEIYVPMVLRFQFNNTDLTKHLSCYGNRSVAQRWFANKAALELIKMQDDLHMPSWLLDSMNVNYTPPFEQRKANFIGGLSRPTRQIFDLINLVLGISGTAMGAYSTAMISKLQSQQAAITQQLSLLTDRSNEDHENLVELSAYGESLYTYTHTQFAKLSDGLSKLQCEMVDVEFGALYLFERLRIMLKLYGDFSAAASSLFQHTLSPTLLPLKHVVMLIRKLPALTNSIYMTDPTDLYSVATVHAVFPIVSSHIGYILKIPVILRPEMAPVYCLNSVGTLTETKLAQRFVLPRHLVHYSTVADPECEEARYRIRYSPRRVANETRDTYTECIRSRLRQPDLQNCRQPTPDIYLCRESLALKPIPCFENYSLCALETKVHADEFRSTRFTYLVRTTAPSCSIQRLHRQPEILVPKPWISVSPTQRFRNVSLRWRQRTTGTHYVCLRVRIPHQFHLRYASNRSGYRTDRLERRSRTQPTHSENASAAIAIET